MEKHTVSRLVGAPPGYVGYEEGGQLTEAVRRRPYAVILFDEIEKAHTEVFNVLLQLLDDGRLTDGHGRTVDFKNTVVIMTSNVGSHAKRMRDLGGHDEAEMRQQVMDALHQRFAPEFLNRIDEIVMFHALTKDNLVKIVEIQARRLQRLLAERHIGLELGEGAKRALADLGYDPVYGARPLKRTIQRELQDPLARRILEGEFKDGDTVEVDADGEQFLFHKAEQETSR
jgi:ATP-dependent Clp protease ATP-binding subunit ClpB